MVLIRKRFRVNGQQKVGLKGEKFNLMWKVSFWKKVAGSFDGEEQ